MARSRPKKRMTIKTYKEDCLEGMSGRLRENSVDVVVTSPPYNIGVNYSSYNDKIPRDEYLKWVGKWAKGIKRVLKDDSSLFLNIGAKPSDPTVPFEVLEVLLEEFKLQNVIHWIKSIYIEENSYGKNREINVGHYKPINSYRFLNDAHEYIFHLSPKGNVRLNRLAIGVPYKDQSNINRWNGKKNLRCRGNCWFIPYKTIRNRDRDRPHPATFPPQLAENCIKLHGVKKEKRVTVLDPFMGLGNTGIACIKLNVNFIGFEIDSYYFSKALENLEVSGKLRK